MARLRRLDYAASVAVADAAERCWSGHLEARVRGDLTAEITAVVGTQAVQQAESRARLAPKLRQRSPTDL